MMTNGKIRRWLFETDRKLGDTDSVTTHPSKRKIQNLELQRCRLAKLRKKMETMRNHRVLGSFTQFWQHIEEQVEANEEVDNIEYLSGFFHQISKSPSEN